MAIPKELLGNVDLYVEDEDRSLLERASQGLPGISGRLAEPELNAELALFLRMCYKNKSQHKSATYYRTLTHIKVLASRLRQLEAPALVSELTSLLSAPKQQQQQQQRFQPGGRKFAQTVVGGSGGSWSLPSRQAVGFGLGRLHAAIQLCSDLCGVILSCARHLSVLLAQAYFLPLATMATSTLARLYVLFCAHGAALTDAYNALSPAACVFPAAYELTSAAATWDASIRFQTRALPASVTWHVTQGRPPTISREGQLNLWPAGSEPAHMTAAVPAPSAAAVTAAREDNEEEEAGGQQEEEVGAPFTQYYFTQERLTGAKALLDVMPEAAVPRQQKKKGLKKKRQQTGEEVLNESMHKVIIIEDKKGAAKPIAVFKPAGPPPSLEAPTQSRPMKTAADVPKTTKSMAAIAVPGSGAVKTKEPKNAAANTVKPKETKPSATAAKPNAASLASIFDSLLGD